MYDLNLEAVERYGKKYKSVPICKTIPADVATPVEVLRRLKSVSRQVYILESLEDSARCGRYTFLGYDPKLEISCSNGELTIKNGTSISISTDEPGEYIEKLILENESPEIEGLPPFCGGLVGYFSYEYIKYSQPSVKLCDDEEQFKDFDLMLFDKVVAFDNFRQVIKLIVNVKTDELPQNYNKALTELERMTELVSNGKPAGEAPLELNSNFRALFNEQEYCEMVAKVKSHIKEGNIFQAVLSNRLEADASGSLLDAYRILRIKNPSPYMFYLSSDDIEIAGSSPETLVQLQNGKIRTFPLAGTRPRGDSDREDLRLEKELLSDPKELAEHNMLVDLGRNDLGKISKFGSVRVDKYMSVEKFSHVMHIGSTVSGELAGGKRATDAVSAVLPAGTLSGAPKLKACEIISECEGVKRGIYGGAIGYIDFRGNLDVCIAIRLAFKKNSKVFVRSGAGIVADSVPELEYKECENKARAVINALHEANGGVNGDDIAY